MNSVTQYSSNMLMPFLPMFILSLTLIVTMIAIAIKRSNRTATALSFVGLNVALFVLLAQMAGYFSPVQGTISSLFVVDSFAQFNMLIILVCSLACATFTYAYIDGLNDTKEEMYLLLLIATLGAMLMVCADHFAAFFISLELLSVPMYGMLAYTYARNKSLEAGLKYLVLSATASATMLMGMALMYAMTGTLGFRQIGSSVVNAYQYGVVEPTLVVGTALILFGVAFKLSAVPFHTWTPDVYQGAPAPVSAFLGSVAKVAMLALGLRFLLASATIGLSSIIAVIVVIASLSMIIGNLLALRQQNVKRMLSYSSIAHLGYVLAVIASANFQSVGYTSLYMAVYALTTVGAFGVVSVMSSPYQATGEAEHIDNFRGLFWKRPLLTAIMAVVLLSLAGIPLTAGFISKFFAVFATVRYTSWWLAAMIIIGSAISLYYYLHLMVVMFQRPKQVESYQTLPMNTVGNQISSILLILVTLVILYFGIFPDFLARIVAAVRLYQ